MLENLFLAPLFLGRGSPPPRPSVFFVDISFCMFTLHLRRGSHLSQLQRPCLLTKKSTLHVQELLLQGRTEPAILKIFNPLSLSPFRKNQSFPCALKESDGSDVDMRT